MKIPFINYQKDRKKDTLSNVHYAIDYLGKDKNYLIVFGWLYDPKNVLGSAKLFSKNSIISEVSISKMLRFERKDVNEHFGRDPKVQNCGFLFFVPISEFNETQIEIAFVTPKNESLNKKNSKIEKFNQYKFLESLAQLENSDKQAIVLKSKELGLVKNEEEEKKVEILARSVKEITKLSVSKVQMHVDVSLVYNTALFISGWMVDPQKEIYQIDFFQDEVRFYSCKSDDFAKISRIDVQDFLKKEGIEVPLNTGFIKAFRFNDEINLKDPIYLVLKTKQQQLIKTINIPAKSEDIKDFKKVTKKIFGTFPIGHNELFEIYDNHVGPFIKEVSPIWEKKKNKKVYLFGKQNPSPEISLIIPLYGRWDFLIFQLAIFCNDDDFKNAELIYVIDDPSILDAVVSHSDAIFPTYQLPFKLVYGGDNFGFAGANNLGVSEAKGKYVLLMNSDVFPKKQGWISEMIKQHSSLPDAGIIGPRLIYEDESLQHEGMVFEKSNHLKGFWFNIHPGKGQPSWIFNHNKTMEVPMLTGACMLMLKDTYLKVGGFDECYLQGDFEDSDLNMKIKKIGQKSYLMPQVELYHLERKSQSLFSDNDWKLRLTLYNAWQHTNRWNKDIEKLNKEFKYA